MDELGRYLVVYDGSSEEVEDLYELKSFKLEELKSAFDVPDSDTEMHDAYPVGPEDIAYVQEMIGQTLDFDFKNRAYIIEAIWKDV